MKKRPKINGEVVRQERVRRAWTQEELSERSNLGVRTLRRLEAGSGSLESLRRVAEALDLEPAKALAAAVEPPRRPAPIEFDLLRLSLSSSLFQGDSDPFIEALLDRLQAVRRHLGQELGFVLPGVRLVDFISTGHEYKLFVRERLVGDGVVLPGRHLAMATEACQLNGLRHPLGADPIHGNPATWIDADEHKTAVSRGCLVLSGVELIAAHLTQIVKSHISRLLDIEAVAGLLEDLSRPNLVAEVIPEKISLTKLRSLLRQLLEEGCSIRDLGWILETLADMPDTSMPIEELIPSIRSALGA